MFYKIITDIANLFVDPLLNIWDIFSAYVPNIAAAFIFILVGLFLARFVSTFLEQILRKIRFDFYTGKVGINEVVTRFGFGNSPTAVLSFILYWSLLLVFFVTAANILNLSVISGVVEQFLVGFIPKISAAVFISFGGLLFANFLSAIIENASRANNIKGGASLARIAHFVVVVFTIIAAIEQFGIKMKIIEGGINILLGAIGLAFAIAVGWGAKDIAHDVIKAFFTENKNK